MDEQMNEIDELAQDILKISRNTLLVKFRFLDRALSMFRLAQYQGTISTDGQTLYYNPIHILKNFQAEREFCVREYLHVVMHCVFQHMFVGNVINRRFWNLACDIAVENVISNLFDKSTIVKRESSEISEIANISKNCNGLTAEKLYRYLLDSNLEEDYICNLEQLYLYDDHSLWYQESDESAENNSQKENNDTDSNHSETSDDSEQKKNSSDTNLSNSSNSQLSQEWKNISERMQEELTSFSNVRGEGAGSIIQSLKEVNREKYDYTSFLKKFAVYTEVMKINEDEFDYIFYTYGLKQYKRMPFVEPLEYKDAKRLREFVIAIDTSGSTSGELVQKFVQKTYNILKSTETFASKINLHIIQCDTIIQEDIKITSQNEFDEYLKDMTIKGLGGTDFRPVFEYVLKLQNNHEFSNLKGLIYFTDGHGEFPTKKPPYDVAFVFIDEGYNNYDVPTWAIKLILKKDEI